MNQAEIIAMATEAGFEWDSLGLRDRLCFEHFAALVAAKERERLFGKAQSDGEMRLQLTRWEDGECFSAAAHFSAEQTHCGGDDLLTNSVERLDDSLDACIAAAIRARVQKEGA